MFQWQQSQERLNRQAGLLQGERLTFHVHYWGVSRHLVANPVHKHSFFEICYVEGGTGIYTEGDREYSLHRGVLFCSRPGVVHQIRDVNELDLLYVAFEPDEKQSDPAELESYLDALGQGEVWMDNQSGSPIAGLWRSLLVPDSYAGALSAGVLPALAHSLLASFPDLLGVARSSNRPPVRTDSSILVQRTKQYIRDNLAGDLSQQQVARLLNVSERHLSRLFAENIKESYTTTVRNERIRAAEELLIRTGTPIKEIAEQVGFSSVHYFTRSFTQKKGMPPAAYREANWRHADHLRSEPILFR